MSNMNTEVSEKVCCLKSLGNYEQHEHGSQWEGLLPKVITSLKRRVESSDGMPSFGIGIQVGPMQMHINILDFLACVCMLLVCATLITHFSFVPSSNALFFLLPCSYEYILLILKILNSIKNKNEVKFSKNCKILCSHVIT